MKKLFLFIIFALYSFVTYSQSIKIETTLKEDDIKEVTQGMEKSMARYSTGDYSYPIYTQEKEVFYFLEGQEVHEKQLEFFILINRKGCPVLVTEKYFNQNMKL